MKTSKDRLLDTKQLAARWGVAVGTLQNARADGTSIPYVKLGRLVRYRLEDIVAEESAQLVEPAYYDRGAS